MDARERLRLYLEQRRELGESELVLDGLAVDDVLAVLGARPPRTAKRAADSAPTAAPVTTVSSAAVAPPRRTVAADHPAVPLTGAPPAAVRQATVPPPAVHEPDVRFDASIQTNWRDALRQANAQPASDGAAQPAASTRGPELSETSRAAVLPAWLAPLSVAAGVAVVHTRAQHGHAHSAQTLDEVSGLIHACTRCALHTSARSAVPGEGDPQAELLCVGEAPGANEDETGRPFVGDAGQLFTKILSAIQLSREQVFICNVLKHRPPANRDPLPDEVAACTPFLERQITLVAPRVILALGRFAAQSLLGTSLPLGKLRSQIHLYHDIPVIVTYHPAALLRNEAWKRPTWEDVQLARRVLDASRAATPRRHDTAGQ